MDWQNDFRAVRQTVGLWFVMWAKGKFGGWGASVLLRIQECKKLWCGCFTGRLRLLHRAIPFMPLAVCVVEQKETDSWDRARGLVCFTSCDLLKVSNSTIYCMWKRTALFLLIFFSFSYHQDCASHLKIFFHSSPVEEAENVAQVCSFTFSFFWFIRSFLFLL